MHTGAGEISRAQYPLEEMRIGVYNAKYYSIVDVECPA